MSKIKFVYWIKHKLYTSDTRNLGYYSESQNEMVNLFRSLIIDWLNIPDNIKLLTELDPDVKKIIPNPIVNIDPNPKSPINSKLIINKYIVKLMEKNIEDNLGLLELFILNNIHQIPTVMILNGIPKYYINNNGIKIIKGDNWQKYLNSSNICLSLEINKDAMYPNIAESVFYK